MKTRTAVIITVIVIVGCLALVLAQRSGVQSGVNGTWIKKSGRGDSPGQVSIQVSDSVAKFKFFEDGGVATVTLLCDGEEHLYNRQTGTNVHSTYRARCDKHSITSTRYSKTDPELPMGIPEQWAVSKGGKELLFGSGNEIDAVYVRPSLLHRLLSGTP